MVHRMIEASQLPSTWRCLSDVCSSVVFSSTHQEAGQQKKPSGEPKTQNRTRVVCAMRVGHVALNLKHGGTASCMHGAVLTAVKKHAEKRSGSSDPSSDVPNTAQVSKGAGCSDYQGSRRVLDVMHARPGWKSSLTSRTSCYGDASSSLSGKHGSFVCIICKCVP